MYASFEAEILISISVYVLQGEHAVALLPMSLIQDTYVYQNEIVARNWEDFNQVSFFTSCYKCISWFRYQLEFHFS